MLFKAQQRNLTETVFVWPVMLDVIDLLRPWLDGRGFGNSASSSRRFLHNLLLEAEG